MVAFVVLVAAVLFGMSEAGFQCCRDISKDKNENTLLNLTSLLNLPLSLESICYQTCSQSQCSSDDVAKGLLGQVTGGLAGTLVDLVTGPAQCILNPNGDGSNPNKLTNNQACLIPCILQLDLLGVCQVQAIVSSLIKQCPQQDSKALCVSACACCGDSDQPLDLCVDACLSNNGIGVNAPPVLGSGTGPVAGGKQLPPLPVAGGGANGGLNIGGSGGLISGLGNTGSALGSVSSLTGAASGLTGAAGGLGGLTGAASGLTGGAGGATSALGGAGGATSALGGATSVLGGAGGATGALGGATGALGGLGGL